MPGAFPDVSSCAITRCSMNSLLSLHAVTPSPGCPDRGPGWMKSVGPSGGVPALSQPSGFAGPISAITVSLYH